MGIGDWGLGIGDWGLGGWGQDPTPKPKHHKPQTPNPIPHFLKFSYKNLYDKI